MHGRTLCRLARAWPPLLLLVLAGCEGPSPASLELSAYQLRVRQGDENRLVGFVRRGDTISMTAAEDDFDSLQGRGATFFARTFPEAGARFTQRLPRCGVVELMSGSGAFWM